MALSCSAVYIDRSKVNLNDDSITVFIAYSRPEEGVTGRRRGKFAGGCELGVGASGCSSACDDGHSDDGGIMVEFVITGLGVATLGGLLDFLLSFCAFFAAQLAEEGRAEPSPLSLRLIASSRTADCEVGLW